MAINADWHRAHVMARNASLDERVAWHLEHAEACGCRAMPRTVTEELARRRQAQQRAPQPGKAPRAQHEQQQHEQQQ
jgi:hypothetical protein